MAEKLIPAARRAYEKQLAELERQLDEKRLQFGSAVGTTDGDTYHDETAALLEREKLELESRVYRIRHLLNNSETLERPSQDEQVSPGHTVNTRLSEGKPPLVTDADVTILPPENTGALIDHFDGETNLLASTLSALGSALLGKRKGDLVDYQTPSSTNSAKVKDIKPSNLFEE
jgi:transcription elongation GreA/GreB family factor